MLRSNSKFTIYAPFCSVVAWLLPIRNWMLFMLIAIPHPHGNIYACLILVYFYSLKWCFWFPVNCTRYSFETQKIYVFRNFHGNKFPKKNKRIMGTTIYNKNNMHGNNIVTPSFRPVSMKKNHDNKIYIDWLGTLIHDMRNCVRGWCCILCIENENNWNLIKTPMRIFCSLSLSRRWA